MSARWLDLVDPTPEELHRALPARVDPEVVELATSSVGAARSPRPIVESHGAYVFGVVVAIRPHPEQDRVDYQEIDFVATGDLLVTVRKSSADGGEPFEPVALHRAAEAGLSSASSCTG